MAARKSIMYLNSVIPVTKTQEELINQKFKPGKFVMTVTGGIKITGIILLVTTLSLILSSSFCDEVESNRILAIASIGTTAGVSLLLYIIFSSGFVVKKTGIWVAIDIIINLILSIFTIVSMSIAMNGCRLVGSLLPVPGPLGIVGSIILIIGCASLSITYRYNDEEQELGPNGKPQRRPTIFERARKSIFT